MGHGIADKEFIAAFPLQDSENTYLPELFNLSLFNQGRRDSLWTNVRGKPNTSTAVQNAEQPENGKQYNVESLPNLVSRELELKQSSS